MKRNVTTPASDFAYGSNLDQTQLLSRCPSARLESAAVSRGYALAFGGFTGRWNGAVATIARVRVRCARGTRETGGARRAPAMPTRPRRKPLAKLGRMPRFSPQSSRGGTHADRRRESAERDHQGGGRKGGAPLAGCDGVARAALRGRNCADRRAAGGIIRTRRKSWITWSTWGWPTEREPRGLLASAEHRARAVGGEPRGPAIALAWRAQMRCRMGPRGGSPLNEPRRPRNVRLYAPPPAASLLIRGAHAPRNVQLAAET